MQFHFVLVCVYVALRWPWRFQAWLPEYHKLGEETSEKVVAGLFVFGFFGSTAHWTAGSRALHDAHIFDAFGGFAECRRAWRRYDYARDHALACSTSGFGDDLFLWFQIPTPWSVWHGQVAMHGGWFCTSRLLARLWDRLLRKGSKAR